MNRLTFNRLHRNGWVSFKLQGVPGAVYVDRRMFAEGQIPVEGSTISLDVAGLAEPGADAKTLSAEKAAEKLVKEQARAEKSQASAVKAAERLEKLKAQVEKANAAVESAKARGSASAAETTGDPSSL